MNVPLSLIQLDRCDKFSVMKNKFFAPKTQSAVKHAKDDDDDDDSFGFRNIYEFMTAKRAKID